MLKRKIGAVALAFLLLFHGGLWAYAEASEESAWTELLKFSTVNDSGSNWFKYTTSATVSIPTPYSMRLTKIDMLITYPASTGPTNVEVYYNGTYYALEMRRIDETTSRVYGTIQNNFYSDVRVRFTRGNAQVSYLEILSCRVSQVMRQEVSASAQVFVDNTYYSVSTNINIPGDDNPIYANINSDAIIRIDVQDWMKYDTLSVWGSSESLAVSSIRVNVGTLGVPFDVSYMSNVESNEWTEWVTDYGGDSGCMLTFPHFYGKTLYCITIDLQQLDRTYNFNGSSYPMYIYLTGTFPADIGYSFNCQYVNGSVIVPDKTDAAWWTRFTDFMRDLMNPASSHVNQFQHDAEVAVGELENANDQLQEVERPDVEQVVTDFEQFVPQADVQFVGSEMAALTSNGLFSTLLLMGLGVALIGYILYGKR